MAPALGLPVFLERNPQKQFEFSKVLVYNSHFIKFPKFYFVDSGLACYLLNIETKARLASSPFLGHLFEGFVASEILKLQMNSGKRRELYYFRDQQGLEVDFLIPSQDNRLILVRGNRGTRESGDARLNSKSIKLRHVSRMALS